MWCNAEAFEVLRAHRIPYYPGVEGLSALLRKGEIDFDLLRKLGFRISGKIGGQLVVSYKGNRFGLIM